MKGRKEGSEGSMQQLEKYEFDGDQLDLLRQETRVAVVVRRVCEALGISEEPQRRKLRECAWARATIMVAHDASGREQELFCLDLDSLPMWLATINPGKVREELRPKLIRYQRECAQVLRDHFLKAPSKPAAIDREELLAILSGMLGPSLGQMLDRQIAARLDPVIARIESAFGTVQQHPEGLLPRAELKDHPTELAQCRSLITQTARALGVSWNKVQGELLKKYQVRSYRRLPFMVWDAARDLLIAMMAAAPVPKKNARGYQRSLFDFAPKPN